MRETGILLSDSLFFLSQGFPKGCGMNSFCQEGKCKSRSSKPAGGNPILPQGIPRLTTRKSKLWWLLSEEPWNDEIPAGREQILGHSQAVCCPSNHGNSAGKEEDRDNLSISGI